MIELHELCIGYGSRRLLNPISLQFPAGQFTAIVGPNGAGKTTLLRTLAGLRPPLAGRAYIDDAPVELMSARMRARRLAFVDSETPVFGNLTATDIIAMGRLPFRAWWRWDSAQDDIDAVNEAIEACDLQAFRNRKFRLLSSGEQQRVWVAAAFAQRAPVLLLDEPTSRLDIRYAIDVLNLLRNAAELGATVIASMHDLERAAAFADRVIVIGRGSVLADGPPEYAVTEAVLLKAYGVEIDVRHEHDRVWLSTKKRRMTHARLDSKRLNS